MTAPTRVLVADDEPLIRLLLRHTLERRPGLEIVGEAADGAEALSLIEALQPDIVVLDLSMPEPDGLEVTRRLRAARNACGIVVFSSTTGAEPAVLACGADRFVDKAAGVEDAVDAVVALSALRGPGG
ncbi:response regulator [Solirubrobacter sp. CPCC 204708]|uniref:Response regulator n=1 Tax=Solirubrobacter deserti TaxID=2282478 RepID=A0ABT4RSN2_9ACTN|nr:response regulator [Solirubrobacter deserti]MBE2314357.1 response regulator [Solirubrobacter deserti]MDA0141455.1 response regulator [Solirubrobacter deserti]